MASRAPTGPNLSLPQLRPDSVNDPATDALAAPDGLAPLPVRAHAKDRQPTVLIPRLVDQFVGTHLSTPTGLR